MLCVKGGNQPGDVDEVGVGRWLSCAFIPLTHLRNSSRQASTALFVLP
jgi:hypothetical protein